MEGCTVIFWTFFLIWLQSNYLCSFQNKCIHLFNVVGDPYEFICFRNKSALGFPLFSISTANHNFCLPGWLLVSEWSRIAQWLRTWWGVDLEHGPGPSVTSWPWANYLTSLCFGFLHLYSWDNSFFVVVVVMRTFLVTSYKVLFKTMSSPP